MSTPEKKTRIAVFVPSRAVDELRAVATKRAESLHFTPDDADLWREAIMRGLAAMKAEASPSATTRRVRTRTGTRAHR